MERVANFLIIEGPAGFRHRSHQFRWNERASAFMLAQDQKLRLNRVGLESGRKALTRCAPGVCDAYGFLGQLSPDRKRFEQRRIRGTDAPEPVRARSMDEPASTAAELVLDPVDAPDDTSFVDASLGGDGRVALPYTNGVDRHGLKVVHLRQRWQMDCELPEAPVRAAVGVDGAAWVLCRGRVLRCEGQPLPHPFVSEPLRFEPVSLTPEPLRVVAERVLPNFLPLGIALDERRAYVLAYDELEFEPHYRQRVLSGALDAREPFRDYPLSDPDAPFAIDLAVVAPGRVALLVVTPGAGEQRDCLPVELDHELGEARVVKERYATVRRQRARFVTAVDRRPRYLSEDGIRELVALPQAHYPERASVVLLDALDGLMPGAHWHRVYLEACVPEGAKLSFEARVSETTESQDLPWIPVPTPGWVPAASELPFRPNHFPSRKDREGLFEILLQRPSGRVRELRGRYLELRVTMTSDGRQSPAIHALRVYCPRFSWQEAHLPRHFHQLDAPVFSGSPAGVSPGIAGGAIVLAPPADDPANAADVRQRMLCAFEGIVDPVEQRIAASEVLLDPAAAPLAILPRFGDMLGESPPAHWPAARRRAWTTCLGDLQRLRGTLAGIHVALDIATDGALGRGQVVVLENFRFRRTLSTILGLDLDDAEHPLTLGTSQSGNSRVGEALILTAEHAREFMALLAPELAGDADDAAAVGAFFDGYAHRLTILLHGSVAGLEAVVREILPSQLPAHLVWNLLVSSHPFVLGLSPLLGVDTYLERSPAWRRVVLNRTYLSRADLLHNPIALAPERLGDRLPGFGGIA